MISWLLFWGQAAPSGRARELLLPQSMSEGWWARRDLQKEGQQRESLKDEQGLMKRAKHSQYSQASERTGRKGLFLVSQRVYTKVAESGEGSKSCCEQDERDVNLCCKMVGIFSSL